LTNLETDDIYPSAECETCYNNCGSNYRGGEDSSFEAYFGCHMTCGNMTASKIDYDVNDYRDCLGSVCSDSYDAVLADTTANQTLDDF